MCAYVHVCVCVLCAITSMAVHVSQHTYGGQGTSCVSQFSPSTVHRAGPRNRTQIIQLSFLDGPGMLIFIILLMEIN